ncbi:MAG: hypothetical protein U9N54_07700 [candidate division Zixibacteria bacterium]|nr:hypothetical protein [candidate division Zixibacteria bacterium]
MRINFIFELNEKEVELSEEEARELHSKLIELFGEKAKEPCSPTNPNTPQPYPWYTPTFGEITCSDRTHYKPDAT